MFELSFDEIHSIEDKMRKLEEKLSKICTGLKLGFLMKIPKEGRLKLFLKP